jgi:hypothetical protein
MIKNFFDRNSNKQKVKQFEKKVNDLKQSINNQESLFTPKTNLSKSLSKTNLRSVKEFVDSQMKYLNKVNNDIEKKRIKKLEESKKNSTPVPKIDKKSKDIFNNSIKDSQFKEEVHNRLYKSKSTTKIRKISPNESQSKLNHLIHYHFFR